MQLGRYQKGQKNKRRRKNIIYACLNEKKPNFATDKSYIIMGHLSSEQRYTISVLKSKGKSQKEIAATIGKDKSVVSRELSRNSDQRDKVYKHDLAQRKCVHRHKTKRKHRRFTDEVKAYVEAELGNKLSPEQIRGIAKKKGLSCVSVERIYQHVWKDKKTGGSLHKCLRNKGKAYRDRGDEKDKRGQIQGRISISERPAIVETKERLGDLEIDTIIGKDRKGAILTMNDRASGMVKIAKLKGKDAEELAKKAIERLADWQGILHTITSDNGKEFAKHQTIASELKIQFFFADPYKSWQRGANENLNGLIRQYIPKKTNFDDIDDEYIQKIETELNNRPRKRFNFQSPQERFNELLLNSA
jgi:transposase, IS30 family